MVSKLSIKMYVILGLIIILSITYAMYTKGDREGLTLTPPVKPLTPPPPPPPPTTPSQPLSIQDIINIAKKILSSSDSPNIKLTNIMNNVVLPNEKRNLQSISAIKEQAKSQLFEDVFKVNSINTTLQTMK
jgi:hypothetical protein